MRELGASKSARRSTEYTIFGWPHLALRHLMQTTRRSTALYLSLLVVTIALGLATRRFSLAFPLFVARYGGDALWAAMILWLVALLRPIAATRSLALVALGISFAVEISQLYRAPWVDAIRATRAGALVLGQGFLWSDLVSYSVGVLLAAALDAWLASARVSRTATEA